MFYRRWGGGGWSRKSNRDHTKAKSRKFWRRVARQEFIRQFLMSPRDMRKYWNDQNKALYGPGRCYSRVLQMKRMGIPRR